MATASELRTQYEEAVRAEIRREIALELLNAPEVAKRSLGPGFIAAAYKLDPTLRG